jgi:hypothetical protein
MGRVPAAQPAGKAGKLEERHTVNSAGALRVAARGSAFRVSYRKLGSANGIRTRELPVQASSVESKWLCFQSGWYSAIVRNTATDRRRHSAVTARPRTEGLGRGGHCSGFPSGLGLNRAEELAKRAAMIQIVITSHGPLEAVLRVDDFSLIWSVPYTACCGYQRLTWRGNLPRFGLDHRRGFPDTW